MLGHPTSTSGTVLQGKNTVNERIVSVKNLAYIVNRWPNRKPGNNLAIRGNPLSNGPKVLFTTSVAPNTLGSEDFAPGDGTNKTGVRDRQLVTYVFAPPITHLLKPLSISNRKRWETKDSQTFFKLRALPSWLN